MPTKKYKDNKCIEGTPMTLAQLISELETIADNIEGDSYTADAILDLIAKLKQPCKTSNPTK